MAHPKMFDDDDPLLARVRALAGALPGALEKISHGHPAFYTKKVFAYYGGSLKQEGAWVQHPHSLTVLPDESDRRALLGDPRVYVPAYLGPSGWIGVDLDGSTDWDEVAELLDASYRLTAPKRLIAELDRGAELSRRQAYAFAGTALAGVCFTSDSSKVLVHAASSSEMSSGSRK